MIATASLSAIRRIVEVWNVARAIFIASAGGVPAGTALSLKPMVLLSRWLITARPPSAQGTPIGG